MQTINRMAACCMLAFSATSAHAIPILSVNPDTVAPSPGSQLTVDVSISGLGGEFVGDYDLTLGFDDSILDLAAVTFGSFLDGPSDSIQGFEENPTQLEVFEISFGFLLNQDGFTPFSLFTATFDVLAAGTSQLDLGVNAIGGFFGSPLGVQTQDASVTVVPVPAPGTIPLLGAALLVIGGRRAISASRASRRKPSAAESA